MMLGLTTLQEGDPTRTYVKHPHLHDADLEREFFAKHPGLRSLVAVGVVDHPQAAATSSGTTSTTDAAAPPLVFQHIQLHPTGPCGDAIAFPAESNAPMLTPTYDLLSSAPSSFVRIATAPLPGAAHVHMDLVSLNTRTATPTLVEGVNGSGFWAIAGVVWVRNEGKRSCKLSGVSIALEVEFTGFTLSGSAPDRKGGKQRAGVAVPFQSTLFDSPPIILVEDIDIAPNEDFFASFRFPFTAPGPPSIDLKSSIAHPTGTTVAYRLTARAQGTKASTWSPSAKHPALLSYNVPVPSPQTIPSAAMLATAQAAAAAAPARRISSPGQAPGTAWWLRVGNPVASPGGAIQVEIAVNPTAGVTVSEIEVSLIEYVAHSDPAPAAEPDAPPSAARATSCVAKRLRLLKHAMQWSPLSDSSNAADSNPWHGYSSTLRLLSVTLKVPRHACNDASEYGPTLDGTPLDPPKAGAAPPPLRRMGRVVSHCVNYDGRWNGVVVAHEVVCRVWVERNMGQGAKLLVDWSEGVVPVAIVGGAGVDAEVFGDDSGLPEY